ncbi:MAG: hypothetical protein ACE5HQ_03080 [Gemmatimonadota bacterium]
MSPRESRPTLWRMTSGVAVAALVPIAFAGAQAPPDTDIYVAELEPANGTWNLGAVTNITHREGYDNQPQFTPDGRALLYTSIREDGQADTYRYDLDTGATTRLTATPESEYSPTPMPGGFEFSAVRVEADSTQRLWAFQLDGSQPRLLLPDVAPVGYHAWADDTTVALFLLGDPPTLHIAHLRADSVEKVADGVGRSVHRIPGRHAVSFVRKRSKDEWWIESFSLDAGRVAPLTRTRPGNEDYTWTPDGAILMGDGARLFVWRRGSTWRRLADLESAGLGRVTRLAVSPDGRRLAIVAATRRAPEDR